MVTKKKATKPAELDAHELRAVAAQAQVDPRTVAKLLETGSPRQSKIVRNAIVEALRARGHREHVAALEGAA